MSRVKLERKVALRQRIPRFFSAPLWNTYCSSVLRSHSRPSPRCPASSTFVALDVAGHEGQAGNAEADEVVVVAQLPGALLGAGEVVDLDEVDQVRVAAFQVGEGVVAVHSLPGRAEGMVAKAVGEHAVERLVVDAAGLGRAAVGAAGEAQVAGQFAGTDRPAVQQADEVLAVDVLQVAVVIAGGELVGELVVQSAEVEVIGADPGEAAVLVVQREVLGVAGVADLGLFQAPGGEAEVLDLPSR